MSRDVQLIIAISALTTLTLLVMSLIGRRGSAPQDARVRWFSAPRNRPAVYMLRLRSNPEIIKVGYTARKVETRMAEIAAQVGPVDLLFSLRMPHAYAVEQMAHRSLRRAWGVKRVQGEWYRVSPHKARRVILRSARKVRMRARLRFSWPRQATIFVWRDL